MRSIIIEKFVSIGTVLSFVAVCTAHIASASTFEKSADDTFNSVLIADSNDPSNKESQEEKKEAVNKIENNDYGFTLDQATAKSLTDLIDEKVSKEFLDKSKVEKIWRPVFDAEREKLYEERNLLQFANKTNSLLGRLHSSHTQLYTKNDEAFFFMRNLFGDFIKEAKDSHKADADFVGLGVGGAQASPNQVRYVLDSSPAAKSGFQRGDVIKSVNGKPYQGYAVWLGGAGKSHDVVVERNGKNLTLHVTPVKQDFLDGYVKATETSSRIIKHGNKSIGYMHFWSGGVDTHEALEDLLTKNLRNTDGLILDLRDGYGGASNEDLNIFFRPHAAFPDQEMITRHNTRSERSFYDKPMVVLINRGTRSGKEIMAFGLKRSKRATLFGENTAGYVVGGRYNPIDPRVMLYLATVDIKFDGARLEGKGVSPDFPVEDKLGKVDPVFDAAAKFLWTKISK